MRLYRESIISCLRKKYLFELNVYKLESSLKVKLLLNETIDTEFYKNVTRWIVKKTSDIKNTLKIKHYIYWLSEIPSVKDIRYIGRTNNQYRRLFEHSSLLFMDEPKEKMMNCFEIKECLNSFFKDRDSSWFSSLWKMMGGFK